MFIINKNIKTAIFFWTIGCLLLLHGSVPAQTCCSGGVPISSNIGLKSKGKKVLQLGLSLDFNVLTTLKSGSQTLDDNLRKRTTQSAMIRAAYELTDNWSIETLFPVIRLTRTIVSNDGAVNNQFSFGFGDPAILGIYKWPSNSIALRTGLGIQIPLGSTKVKNDDGLLFIEDLQPGSGALDAVVYLDISYPLPFNPNYIVGLNSIYSITGTNNNSRNGTQSYRFGNDLQMIASAGFQYLLLNDIASSTLRLRYRNAAHDLIDESDLPGTGGEWLFGALSQSISLSLNTSLSILMELPLYAFVNDTQLSPTYRINATFIHTFLPGNPTLNFNY